MDLLPEELLALDWEDIVVALVFISVEWMVVVPLLYFDSLKDGKVRLTNHAWYNNQSSTYIKERKVHMYKLPKQSGYTYER